jgi:hypothetical protein
MKTWNLNLTVFWYSFQFSCTVQVIRKYHKQVHLDTRRQFCYVYHFKVQKDVFVFYFMVLWLISMLFEPKKLHFKWIEIWRTPWFVSSQIDSVHQFIQSSKWTFLRQTWKQNATGIKFAAVSGCMYICFYSPKSLGFSHTLYD